MRFAMISMALFLLACAYGQETAPAPLATPLGDWWRAMGEGQSGWATLTFGPITAVYEGVPLHGHGCGGNHTVTDMNGGESKCLCGLTTKTTNTAITVGFHRHEFQVLEPGTMIEVDGVRHAVDPFHHTVIHFPATGKAMVTRTPIN
jgi:hypothetical protein